MKNSIMNLLLITAAIIAGATTGSAQTVTADKETDASLRAELVGLHTKWFKAFDSGDGATMDQLEVSNLILVMPTGQIFTKTNTRASGRQTRQPGTERVLSDVSVRRFGETAILIGTLATRSVTANDNQRTTVVFVRDAGHWKIASAQWTEVAGGK